MPELLGAFLSATVAANSGLSDQMSVKRGETNADSRHASLVPGHSGTRNKQIPRSGTRIPCQVPAKLTSLDPTHPFADSCLVILVNPQGCAAHFRRPVEVGTSVRLEGLPSGRVTAQVVNCISLDEHQNSWLLGLALAEPGNVWGVEAPPEDWAC